MDFFSYLGPICPLCGAAYCFRQIPPYWRYAIELFPEFEKEKLPIARFLCRKRRRTFSLLPIQLIPYRQYSVSAIIGTLLLGVYSRRMGRKGLWGASVAVHPDADLTPWLIACWLAVILKGLRRAHGMLRSIYELSSIRTVSAWEEVEAYFLAFNWKSPTRRGPPVLTLLHQYSRATARFLFGTPSQERACIRR